MIAMVKQLRIVFNSPHMYYKPYLQATDIEVVHYCQVVIQLHPLLHILSILI